MRISIQLSWCKLGENSVDLLFLHFPWIVGAVQVILDFIVSQLLLVTITAQNLLNLVIMTTADDFSFTLNVIKTFADDGSNLMPCSAIGWSGLIKSNLFVLVRDGGINKLCSSKAFLSSLTVNFDSSANFILISPSCFLASARATVTCKVVKRDVSSHSRGKCAALDHCHSVICNFT